MIGGSAQQPSSCRAASISAMSSKPGVLLALLYCAYGAQLSRCQCHNSTELSIRVDTLLAEYDRELRPPDTGALLVHAALDVKHATIDQEHSTMRLLTDLKLIWNDERLKWDESQWGCDYAITSAERLWLPDIVLVNAAATGASSSPNDVGLRARVDSTGNVTWVMRMDLTAPIAMNIYEWPRDTQTCVFRFGSRSYDLMELEIRMTELMPAVVFESGPWEILSITGNTDIWQRGEEALSLVSWRLSLRRRAPAHSVAASSVLVAAALLLCAAVALPPDQRPPLAACTSFTAALWLMTALGRWSSASGCPLILSLMCATCVCGACCAACAGLVRRVARESRAPPQWLRNSLSSLSTICRLTPSAGTCDPSACGERGAWTAAAAALDRAVCAALLLTVAVLMLLLLL